MHSRRSRCAALSAALVVTGASAAVAASVSPPAGTPNMAAMVIQPSDLAAGAIPGQQGYVAPPTGFSAQFDADFKTASTQDGVTYFSLSDYVALSPSATTVSTFFGDETAVFRSKAGHRRLSAVIIAAAGKKAHLKARNIRYADLGSVGVGQSSFAEAISVHAKHVSVHEDVVLFQQGTAYGFVVMAANPGEKIPTSDASLLATAMDSHINSVLGATGVSGSTGTS